MHDWVMVLIESLYDEFYSTFEDKCSQGGEYCHTRKISKLKPETFSYAYRLVPDNYSL